MRHARFGFFVVVWMFKKSFTRYNDAIQYHFCHNRLNPLFLTGMFVSAYGDDGPKTYSDAKKKVVKDPPESQPPIGPGPATALKDNPFESFSSSLPELQPLGQSQRVQSAPALPPAFAHATIHNPFEAFVTATPKPPERDQQSQRAQQAPAPPPVAIATSIGDPFLQYANDVKSEPVVVPPVIPDRSTLQGPPPRETAPKINPFQGNDSVAAPPANRRIESTPQPAPQPKADMNLFDVDGRVSVGTANPYDSRRQTERTHAPVILAPEAVVPQMTEGRGDTVISNDTPSAPRYESKDTFLFEGIGSRIDELNQGVYIQYANAEPIMMDKKLTYKTEAGIATLLSGAIRTIPGVPPETVISNIAIGQKHVVDATHLDPYSFRPLLQNQTDVIALRTSVVNSTGHTDDVCIVDAVAIKRGDELLVGLDTRIKDRVDEHDVRLYDKKRITVLNDDGAIMFATTLCLEPQPLLLPARTYEFRDSKTDALITVKGILDITAEHDPRPDGLKPLIVPFKREIVGGKIQWSSMPNLQDAMYSMTPRFEGYISTSFKVIKVQNKFMKENTKAVFMSKQLVFNNQLEVKLSWGMVPRDLDLHVHTSTGDHVYFSSKASGDGSLKLDIDKMHGIGPETITVKVKSGVKYRFYVHNYTGGDTFLYSSSAKVEFIANANSFQMIIPTAPHASSARYWDCFELLDGKVKKIDKVVERAPEAGVYS